MTLCYSAETLYLELIPIQQIAKVCLSPTVFTLSTAHGLPRLTFSKTLFYKGRRKCSRKQIPKANLKLGQRQKTSLLKIIMKSTLIMESLMMKKNFMMIHTTRMMLKVQNYQSTRNNMKLWETRHLFPKKKISTMVN